MQAHRMRMTQERVRGVAASAAAARCEVIHAMFLIVICLVLQLQVSFVDSVPLSYSISQGGKGECFFERLDSKEHLTVSVFILSGAQLSCSISIQGPVSPVEDDKSTHPNQLIWSNVQKYDHGTRFASTQDDEIHFQDHLDFESILDKERPDYDDFLEDENDQYPEMYHEIVGDDETITAEEKASREKKFEAYKNRMAKQKEQRRKKGVVPTTPGIRREGEPWQGTFQAKAPGYYRVCISSAWHPITAEIELRKSSELGSPDKSGHVPTWERRAAKLAEKLEVPNAAKEEDVQRIKNKIARLEGLLDQIQRKQAIERHQLALHSSVNARSHSRMVLSSLVETIVYMAVTAFQLYVVKKWFQGNKTLLGK